MKLIALILVIFASTSTFASKVVVTPHSPANCKVDDHNRANWIFKLRKEFEDQNKAVFSFYTKHGSCIDQVIETREVEITDVTISITSSGLVLPFSKPAVKAALEDVGSNNIVKVVLAFDKNITFKKSNVKKFQMEFIPQNPYESFYWKLVIKRDANMLSSLAFEKL